MRWEVGKGGGVPGAWGTQDTVLLSVAGVPDAVPGPGYTAMNRVQGSALEELRESLVGEDGQWEKIYSWLI